MTLGASDSTNTIDERRSRMLLTIQGKVDRYAISRKHAYFQAAGASAIARKPLIFRRHETEVYVLSPQ